MVDRSKNLRPISDGPSIAARGERRSTDSSGSRCREPLERRGRNDVGDLQGFPGGDTVFLGQNLTVLFYQILSCMSTPNFDNSKKIPGNRRQQSDRALFRGFRLFQNLLRILEKLSKNLFLFRFHVVFHNVTRGRLQFGAEIRRRSARPRRVKGPADAFSARRGRPGGLFRRTDEPA